MQNLMYYLLYILYFPFALTVSTLCWITNPIACLFVSRQPNNRDELSGLWDLWNTHDNYVDEGFYGNYFVDSGNAEIYIKYRDSAWVRYVYRLKWLTRNTGYGWNYLLFSIPLGKGFQWKGISKPFWLFGMKHNDYNIGWKIHEKDTKAFYAMRILGLRKNNA
jgi:hypothetical protein